MDEVAKVPVRIVKTPKSVIRIHLRGVRNVLDRLERIARSDLPLTTGASFLYEQKYRRDSSPHAPSRPRIYYFFSMQGSFKIAPYINERLNSGAPGGASERGRARGRAVWGGKDGRGRTAQAKVDIFVEPFTHGGDCRDSLTLLQTAARFFICRATLIMSPCGDIRNVPF